jgi:phosphoribosylformylglycinamidine cyclo-ligase
MEITVDNLAFGPREDGRSVFGDTEPFLQAAEEARLHVTDSVKVSGWHVGTAVGSVGITENTTRFLVTASDYSGNKGQVAQRAATSDFASYAALSENLIVGLLNRVSVIGAEPITATPNLFAGQSCWFNHDSRYRALIGGWSKGCVQGGCLWDVTRGEAEEKLFIPGTFSLHGSIVAEISPKSNLISPEGVEVGDAIIIVQGSGIHGSAFQHALKAIDKMPNGLDTLIGDGRTAGEALLDTDVCIVKFMQALQQEKIKLSASRYLSPYGWRMLLSMKPGLLFAVKEIPEPPPLMRQIQAWTDMKDSTLYESCSMGACAVLFAKKELAEGIQKIAEAFRLHAFTAGEVLQSPNGRSKVDIIPRDVTFCSPSERLFSRAGASV